MRKAILILTPLMAFSLTLAQSTPSGKVGKPTRPSQSKPKSTKPKAKAKSTWQSYTPCGVYYKDVEDFVSDFNKGWQPVTETNDNHFLYDADTERCEASTGVLKVWVKVLRVGEKIAGRYALVQYELKCKTDELRIKSRTEYDKGGNVLEIGSLDDSWSDVIPGSVGAAILKIVCRTPS